MSEPELEAEARRLLDTYGPWTVSGTAWWVAAGLGTDPPRDLVEAVKLEQNRRRFAVAPPGGAVILHFRPRPD